MKLDQATLLEAFTDSITTRYADYLLMHEVSEIGQLAVREFFEWCIAENTIDLHAPRNPDGKSFLERRDG